MLPPARSISGDAPCAARISSSRISTVPGRFLPLSAARRHRPCQFRAQVRRTGSFLSRYGQENCDLRTPGASSAAVADDGLSRVRKCYGSGECCAHRRWSLRRSHGRRTRSNGTHCLSSAETRSACSIADDRYFQHLTVEDFEMSSRSPGCCMDRLRTGRNQEALATRHALFFRSVFMPSRIRSRPRTLRRRGASRFADRRWRPAQAASGNQPAACSLVQTIVLPAG